MEKQSLCYVMKWGNPFNKCVVKERLKSIPSDILRGNMCFKALWSLKLIQIKHPVGYIMRVVKLVGSIILV